MTDTATGDDVRAAHLDALPRSARAARELVGAALADWSLDGIRELAMLCMGELAANAVLHGRGEFDVVVRRQGDGVRIEVIDPRPEEVPAAVPMHGTAADITREAATGRGLQIVSSLARRWGYTTSTADKAVWAEIDGKPPEQPAQPIVVDGWQRSPAADDVHLHLRSLPVRTAVASGIQVDELVRDLQLGPERGGEPAVIAELYHLLDTSAPARLGGRHAALRAAGRHLLRFDFHLDAPLSTLTAIAELSTLLETVATQRGGRVVVPPAVADYRGWLLHEGLRQLDGALPQPCPLP